MHPRCMNYSLINYNEDRIDGFMSVLYGTHLIYFGNILSLHMSLKSASYTKFIHGDNKCKSRTSSKIFLLYVCPFYNFPCFLTNWRIELDFFLNICPFNCTVVTRSRKVGPVTLMLTTPVG